MSEPITTALRGLLCARPLGDPCWDAMDAVDAVHAALEAENAALRESVEELDNVGGSMHDGGSITDELREWISSLYTPNSTELKAQGERIADRIDAAYESKIGRAELPKDADGVPWNMGDRDEDGNTVIELKLTSSGWCVITDGGQFYCPGSYRHHTPDSWERIIADAYDGGFRDPDNEHMRARLVERCKALAGDAE